MKNPQTPAVTWYYDKRVTIHRYETGRWETGEYYEYTGPFTSDTTTTNAYSRTFTYVYE